MVMAPNYIVEVRDVNFTRLGQIAPEYLDLKFTEVFRGVGSWELKLPAEHVLLPALKTKGSGIIVTETWDGGSKVYSGRMRSAVLDQDGTDPAGTWTITGADDGIVAAATVVYPNPSLPSNAQDVAYWNVTGDGETVMKQAVAFNTPRSSYSWLTVATNLNRGSTTTVSARFDVLGSVLESAGLQSGLGWRFYQSGNGVIFDVVEPGDLTQLIRLDIENGGLESSTLGRTAPTATRVFVLGQGEGADRTVLNVNNAEANAEAALWGLIWETTKDQRNTDDPAELTKAGSEILTQQGTTVNSLKVVPSDAPGQRLGQDWGPGDLVTVVIEGQETTAIVSQIATAIGPAGVIKQATVGDPVGYDWEAKVGSTIKDQGKRIARLENYIDTNPTPPVVAEVPTGTMLAYMGPYTRVPDGYLLADGSAISRTTYANLLSVIGTFYGTGNGSTTFNLPNLEGRVAVGIDVGGDTQFNVRGETGGSKTNTTTAVQSGSGATVANTTNNLQPYLVVNYIIKT